MSNNDFKYLLQEFSSGLLELVKQKGVCPYEYMNSFKRFFDDKLPDRREFYSSLKDKCVSEKDYFLVVNVCNMFKMKKMGDYHDLYLKTGVFLLADVFEKFIRVGLKYYRLEGCHYFSSPGLSWDTMLKMTGVELELISDIDIYFFVEKAMRGGISYIAKRFRKAKNKYMKSYNDNEPSKCIMYLDTNNLYGWTMSHHLLYSGFKWSNQKEIDEFDVKLVSKIEKAKHVNKNIADSIRHKEYVDVLFGRDLIRHSMKRSQSKLHRFGTYHVCKISRSYFDGNRYVLDDGANSLAYLHKDILNQ